MGAAALRSPWHRTAELEQVRQPLRVVVVGAGITGLATALALQRQGHRVTVLEASRDAASAPPGFHGDLVTGTAIREALEELGLWDKARLLLVRHFAHAVAYSDSQARDALVLEGPEQNDVGDVSRTGLRRLLLRAVLAGGGEASIRFGREVKSFEATPRDGMASSSSSVGYSAEEQEIVVAARILRHNDPHATDAGLPPAGATDNGGLALDVVEQPGRVAVDERQSPDVAERGSTEDAAVQAEENPLEDAQEETCETFSCDLLVGADGVTSTVRQLLKERFGVPVGITAVPLDGQKSVRIHARGRCGDRRQMASIRGLGLVRTHVFVDARGSSMRISFHRGFIVWAGSFWIANVEQRAKMLSGDPTTIRQGVLRYLFEQAWHECICAAVADSADRWIWAACSHPLPEQPSDWAWRLLDGELAAPTRAPTEAVGREAEGQETQECEADTEPHEHHGLLRRRVAAAAPGAHAETAYARPPPMPREASLRKHFSPWWHARWTSAPARPSPLQVVLLGAAAHGGSEAGGTLHPVQDAVDLARHVSGHATVQKGLEAYARAARRRAEARRKDQLSGAVHLARIAPILHMLLVVFTPMGWSVVCILSRFWFVAVHISAATRWCLKALWALTRFFCTLFVLYRLLTLPPAVMTKEDSL